MVYRSPRKETRFSKVEKLRAASVAEIVFAIGRLLS
jgi:hypothetical protein